MRFTTLHRNVAGLWQRNAFVSLLVSLLLFVFGSMLSAAPPVLTDLTVSPSILQVGTGVQPIDISVQVSDPDGNLKVETVKLVATFEGGTKEKLVLTEAEDGSVTIVSIGFLSNIADLLSEKSGRNLIARKVRGITVMGGAYPTGKEYNFQFGGTGPTTKAAITAWPDAVPMTFVGEEGGERKEGKRVYS